MKNGKVRDINVNEKISSSCLFEEFRNMRTLAHSFLPSASPVEKLTSGKKAIVFKL
jgi:hypothetical protein